MHGFLANKCSAKCPPNGWKLDHAILITQRWMMYEWKAVWNRRRLERLLYQGPLPTPFRTISTVFVVQAKA